VSEKRSEVCRDIAKIQRYFAAGKAPFLDAM
jgi:hypothetical protein